MKQRIVRACVNCRLWDRAGVTPLLRAECKMGRHFLRQWNEVACMDFVQWERANNTIAGSAQEAGR